MNNDGSRRELYLRSVSKNAQIKRKNHAYKLAFCIFIFCKYAILFDNKKFKTEIFRIQPNKMLGTKITVMRFITPFFTINPPIKLLPAKVLERIARVSFTLSHIFF